MDRRDFLRKGAMLGGAAMLGSRLPGALAAMGKGGSPGSGGGGAGPVPGSSLLELPAAESPVDTVVVLMMENRSVDHYLGWLATDDRYRSDGRALHGSGFRRFRADNAQTYLDGEGSEVSTYHLPERLEDPYRGCGHPDPGHGWESGRRQWNGGANDGFLQPGSGNDEFAVGYYEASDLGVYDRLVRRGTTFDRYFCSLLAPTFPNREYMHSAQSGGFKTNVLPPEDPRYTTGFTWDTIWDRLRDQAGFVPGLDAGYFFVDLPAILLWGGRMVPFMQHLEEYFARAVAGTLPRVCFVDPGFTTGMRTDDHPYADVRAGQKLVHDIMKAFMEGPQWQRGALFITYDEWGGFFDHVAPPRFRDDLEQSPGHPDDFAQAGFRVPTIMLSPYALPNWVDGRIYDHTSILRFIEWRYLGAPPDCAGETDVVPPWALTLRDANAFNIGRSLQQSIVDAEVDLPPYELPVESLPCEGHALEGTFVGDPIEEAVHDVVGEVTGALGGQAPSAASAVAGSPELEWHAFEKALHAGFFDRMGFQPNLRPVPTL